MRVVFAPLHFHAYVYIIQLLARSVCILWLCIPIFFAFVMHLMHISCDAFTEICAFTVHVTECIHSAFNVLHYCALLCIYNSLHSWLLHSVACACIPDYLHSRCVAFMCILSPPCILMHSERGAFLQLYIHRTCACIQWLCISIVMHYYAFAILCIFGGCILSYLVAF